MLLKVWCKCLNSEKRRIGLELKVCETYILVCFQSSKEKKIFEKKKYGRETKLLIDCKVFLELPVLQRLFFQILSKNKIAKQEVQKFSFLRNLFFISAGWNTCWCRKNKTLIAGKCGAECYFGQNKKRNLLFLRTRIRKLYFKREERTVRLHFIKIPKRKAWCKSLRKSLNRDGCLMCCKRCLQLDAHLVASQDELLKSIFRS